MSFNTAQIRDRAREFGKSISDQEAQQIMNATGGGDEGQVLSYLQRGGSPQGATSQGGGGGSPVDIAKQMFELQQQFQQPAIQKLESGRAGIGQAYGGLREAAQAEKEPLKQRYQNLLADVTKGTREAAASEFTRRGIPLSSGLVEQTVGARLAPQIERIGLEQETGLRDINQLLAQLGIQEQGAQSNLDQAIAAIMGQTGQGAIQSALSIYGQQEQSKQAEAARALSQLQFEQQQNLAQQQFDFGKQQQQYLTLGEGQTVFDPTTGKNIYTAPKSYKPADTYGSGIIPFPEF